MTLNGLEGLIEDKYHRNTNGKVGNHYGGKTKFTHIDTGFDILCWTFPKLKWELLVKPSTINIL